MARLSAARPRRPGRPRQDGRADDVRQKLLAEATRLFSERGFGEVGLREIAQAAGVTPGMVAYYFGGKQGLYEAMLDSVFRTVLERVQALATSPPADAEPVEAFLHIYIGTLSREPWVPQLVVREVLSHATPLRAWFVERFASRAVELLPAMFRREIEAGRLRDDLDPVLTLLSLIGMSLFPFLAYPVLGPLLGYQLDDGFRSRLIAHTAQLFLEGARAQGETP